MFVVRMKYEQFEKPKESFQSEMWCISRAGSRPEPSCSWALFRPSCLLLRILLFVHSEMVQNLSEPLCFNIFLHQSMFLTRALCRSHITAVCVNAGFRLAVQRNQTDRAIKINAFQIFHLHSFTCDNNVWAAASALCLIINPSSGVHQRFSTLLRVC